MPASPGYLTATVVFGYAWSIDEGTKQTLNYTKTYTNYPGPHSLYDFVRNTALPSASQFETVGIDFNMTAPGGQFTHPALATVATFDQLDRFRIIPVPMPLILLRHPKLPLPRRLRYVSQKLNRRDERKTSLPRSYVNRAVFQTSQCRWPFS
jgi:hypothetical protein